MLPHYKGMNIKSDTVPSGWCFTNAGKGKKEFTWLERAPCSGNHYLRVVQGTLTNDIKIKAPRYRLTYSGRGKGQISFLVYRYDKNNKKLPSQLLHTLEGDYSEWENGKFEFDHPGNELDHRQCLAIQVNGEFDIDDVFLSPIVE